MTILAGVYHLLIFSSNTTSPPPPTLGNYIYLVQLKPCFSLKGFMRSYFGGLTCVDWSPDGKYVVVGGQDDLITIWSFTTQAVICRGQGHKSWTSVVRFDPFVYPTSSVAFFSGNSASGDCCNSSPTEESGNPDCVPHTIAPANNCKFKTYR